MFSIAARGTRHVLPSSRSAGMLPVLSSSYIRVLEMLSIRAASTGRKKIGSIRSISFFSLCAVALEFVRLSSNYTPSIRVANIEHENGYGQIDYVYNCIWI